MTAAAEAARFETQVIELPLDELRQRSAAFEDRIGELRRAAAEASDLLDEGRYLASERTMYRILARELGAVRERRAQLEHPTYQAPELLAERPNECGRGTSAVLKGLAKWTYYYLYVILDVFSRYAVGWTVQHRESAQVAAALISRPPPSGVPTACRFASIASAGGARSVSRFSAAGRPDRRRRPRRPCRC